MTSLSLQIDGDRRWSPGEVAAEILAHDARPIVILGTGTHFLDPATAVNGTEEAFRQLASTIAHRSMPVVIVLAGDASGPSLDVALQADLRYAARGIRLRLGLLERGRPAPEAAERLAAVGGPSLAARMVLLDEELTVGDPPADRVAIPFDGPAGEKADELAERLAGKAPLALSALKELITATTHVPFSAGITMEAALAALLLPTADRAEGLQAFARKRLPVFEGR